MTPPEGNPDFGTVFRKRLKQARKEAGYTQKSLASALLLSEDAIQSWEYGRTVPPLQRLDDIALMLGKPPSWFLPRHDDFAMRLVQIREVKGWTQEQLAVAVGVSATQVGEWESHQSVPKVEILRRMPAALGVAQAYLFTPEIEAWFAQSADYDRMSVPAEPTPEPAEPTPEPPVVKSEGGPLAEVVLTLTRLIEASQAQNTKLIERMENGEKERLLLLDRLKQSQDLLELDLRAEIQKRDAEIVKLRGEISAPPGPGLGGVRGATG